MTANRVYTFGYSGREINYLAEFLNKNRAVLADIRYQPSSRSPIWKGSSLAQKFRNRYISIPELGNVNYNNGHTIEINDAGYGTEIVRRLIQRAPVVLLCVCRDYDTCHRKVVSSILYKKLGLKTIEIARPKKTAVKSEKGKFSQLSLL